MRRAWLVAGAMVLSGVPVVPAAGPDAGAVAREYIEAVGQKRFDRVAALLHPDLAFTSPDAKDIHGAEGYVAALKRLAPILLRNDVKRVFADGDEVCVVYDFVTDTAVGTVPSVEWLRLDGGRVRSVRLIFHTASWPKVVQELKARAGQASAPPTSAYLAILRRGPAWVADKPVKDQDLQGHDEYMRSLFAKGVLRLGGPFADGEGGAELFEATSEADAIATVEANPAIRAGVLRYELHRWHTVLRPER